MPVGPSHYLSGVYSPYGSFYYNTMTPAPTPAASKINTAPPVTQPPKPPASLYYPQYYLQMPYYPAPTAAPVAQAPAPLPFSPPPSPPPPLSPPEQPVDPQYPVIPFYPSAPYSSYYHYGQFPYPNPGTEVQPASSSHPSIDPPSPPTTTTRMMVPKHPGSPSYPFGHFYPERPIYFPPFPPPLPAKEKPQTIFQDPQKPVAPQATCLTHAHICGYYPYPYYHPLYPPHYPTPYPAVPQHLQTQPPVTTKKPFTTTTTTPTTATTTPTTSFTPTGPTPQIPHVQCLMGSMDAFLPFAHPDSIQVRGQCWC